ncbi:MAG: hypothetical protein Q9166_003925 [cf. Caloplaca sp. 2 TL-2023]
MASGNVTITPLSIVIIGTCDTKLSELLYLRSQILSNAKDALVKLIDVGRSPVSDPAISLPQQELLTRYGSSVTADLSAMPRGQVMQTMTDCAAACLHDLQSKPALHGVVSIGGSGGTSLASAAMRRALPFLLPKLIVSTVASGDTAPFIGESDITLMYSIVDIAGSNSILNGVLDNAAGGIVGMAQAYQKRQMFQDSSASRSEPEAKKKKIGITMFGVTTPCVDAIRHHLTSKHDYEIYVFHATGHGGRAMERLISSSGLDAIIDLTTSEIADEIVGGVMSAGPHRLEAALEAGIPQVISVGACDIVNFGPRNTVPQRFVDEGRELYEHNSSVTLVRTNVDECKRIGEFIAGKLKMVDNERSLVEVVLPTRGLSVLSKPGEVYADEKADKALFDAIEEGIRGTNIDVARKELYINDDEFARYLAEKLVTLVEKQEDPGVE